MYDPNCEEKSSWFEIVCKIGFVLFVIGALFSIGYLMYEVKTKRDEMSKKFPTGTLVRHKLNNSIGIVKATNNIKVSVLFSRSQGGFDPEAGFDPSELVVLDKTLEDIERERNQQAVKAEKEDKERNKW